VAPAVTRRFELHRDDDVTGVSGAGVVADGDLFDEPWTVRFPDGQVLDLPAGWCRIRWRGLRPSTVLWPSVTAAQAVHGHGGATRFVWRDTE